MPDAVAAIAALLLAVPAHPDAATRQPQPPLLRTSEIQMIGSLGGNYTEARGINDAGQVVGFSFDTLGRRRAFYWDIENGIVDLNDQLTPLEASLWTLRSAEAINNHGQVVGTGWFADQGATITAAFSMHVTPGRRCPADRTDNTGQGPRDGYVNVYDLDHFIRAYAIESAPGYTGPLTCDYAGPGGPTPDGRVDAFDMDYYIALWLNSQGPCD